MTYLMLQAPQRILCALLLATGLTGLGPVGRAATVSELTELSDTSVSNPSGPRALGTATAGDTIVIGPKDFNGDGNANDYATITIGTYGTSVSITHGGSGTTTLYTVTGQMNLAGYINLDRAAGQELILCCGKYVTVIIDRLARKWEKYNAAGPNAADATIPLIAADMDGKFDSDNLTRPEVVLNCPSWVTVIDYTGDAIRNYYTSSITSADHWSLEWFGDLDGVPGKEICFLTPNPFFDVLNDRTQKLDGSWYTGISLSGDPSQGSGIIAWYNAKELNGRPGKDFYLLTPLGKLAILEYPSTSKVTQYYLPPPGSKWENSTSGSSGTWRFQNMNGQAGLEIVFEYGAYEKWVVDSIKKIEPH